jgi:uncharacterized delta-60 repeat protein
LGYPIELGTKASIMPDGKIVVAGLVMQANGDGGRVGIAQYNADGTPDYTFGGGDGVVLTPEIAQLYGSLGIGTSNIAIQADGKVLVGHYSLNQSTSDSDAMLMRFNPDGTFDTSFGGGDGLATADLGSTTDISLSVVALANGKVLTFGQTTSGGALARYNADGSLDTTFGGGDGVVQTPHAFGNAVLSDGRIITAAQDMSARIYSAAGVLENSTSIPSLGSTVLSPVAVIPLSDGKFLVAGVGSYGYAGLVRYNADLTVDMSFGGGDGLAIFGGVSNVGFAVAAFAPTLSPAGKIIATGIYMGSSADGIGVMQINADGSVDTSFGGGDGEVVPLANRYYALPVSGVAFQGSSILLPTATGTGTGLDSQSNFALVRILANGTVDTSFGNGGALGGTAAFTESGPAVVLDTSVIVTDAEAIAAGNYAGTSLTVARSGGANGEDAFAGSGVLGALSEGGNLVVSSMTIGTVTRNSGGTLALSFNSSATQALVNATLSAIAYSNASDAPPASVDLSWTFTDKDGGAANGSTRVNITAANDAPTDISAGALSVSENAANSTLVGKFTGADPDSAGLTWSLLDNAGGRFVIDADDGELHVSNGLLLDFEQVSSHTITVQVSDGTATRSETFAVSLTDIASESVTGSGSADSLSGGNKADTIKAGAGNDTLKGGGGKDSLDGGAGSDTADYSDKTKSVEVDLGGGGPSSRAAHGADAAAAAKLTVKVFVGGKAEDTVSNIESFIGGSKADKFAGNKLGNAFEGRGGADKLDGAAGVDTLTGGAGKDTLTGGSGKDVFVFDSALSKSNVDVIVDFRHDQDKIALDDAIFGAIGPKLQKGEFFGKADASKAHDLNDRIIYDSASGKLYYDDDGNTPGGHAAVLFATLSNKPVLDQGDFIIV